MKKILFYNLFERLAALKKPGLLAFAMALMLTLIACGAPAVRQADNTPLPAQTESGGAQSVESADKSAMPDASAVASIGGWPTGELADKLPVPTTGTVVKAEETSTDGGRAGIQKSLKIIMDDWTREDAKAYVAQLKSAGFANVDVDMESDTLYNYMATREDGYRASVLSTLETYVISISEVPNTEGAE